MRHLLNPLDFSVEEINQLLDLASDIEANPAKYAHVCDGKKIATLFYEPSTRTRLSFEAAMLNLGGRVLGFASADSSSASKGESVADTIRVISCFADICAMRHPKEGAPMVASLHSSIPVINAGDGRSPASDADLDRSDDDPFFKRTPEQFNSRSVRRFEIRTHGSLLNQRAVPLHRHPFRPHFPSGTARPGLYH